MSHEISLNKPNYLVPQTFEQAERYAEKIAISSLCPAAFKNKPGDVLIALQMGAEVGLSPMQALQNIAVINSRPSLWGDAAIGVVRVHPHCQGIREWMEGSIESGNATAYCAVTRKGQQEEVRSFTIENAKKAKLWGKTGPWSDYPQRMLQMRARGFAIRDVFPDALRGLHLAEESQDIVDITLVSEATISHQEKHKTFEGKPLSQSFTMDADLLDKHLEAINAAVDMDLLKAARIAALTDSKGDAKATNDISLAALAKKSELYKAAQDKASQDKQQTSKEWLGDYGQGEEK